MSRKRRIFDIDLPEDLDAVPDPAPETPAGQGEDETFPAGKVQRQRRGPMAAAISETAESLRERRALEAQIREENDRLAHEHVRLRRLGLVAELIPLDEIETWKLVRDRAPGPDPELAELVASIREIGLSNPIRVERREDGRFELVQGYRRLSAYRALLDETGDGEAWGRIPALVLEPGESLEGLYRRMVDENMVRKDVSFAEMAQLAIAYAADPQTEVDDPDKAVAVLFRSAGYQKRSYIRAFIKLMSRLEGDLRFAPEIPRRVGLALVARMEEDEGIVRAIREALRDWDNRSVQDELAVLRRFAGLEAPEAAGQGARAAAAPAPAKPRDSRAKTSIQFDRPEGRARCVAENGRLEVRLDRDFSTVDRHRLEEAVRALLDHLDG